jgi:hypothetical protein
METILLENMKKAMRKEEKCERKKNKTKKKDKGNMEA